MKQNIDDNGNPVPVLAIGGKGFYVDGSSGSALSAVLQAGVYRISVADAITDGLNYTVGLDTDDEPLEAEATDSYLAVGAIETIYIPYGQKIAVMGGNLSVTKMI